MKLTCYCSMFCLLVLFFSACSKNNSSSSVAVTKTAVITVFAGSGAPGIADGAGILAQFNHPYGVALDAAGNIYVSDEGSALIRKITSSAVVSTLAGSGNGYADGTGAAAKFYSPDGVATDASGNIYVADPVNNLIRKVSPTGVVTTLAGSTEGFADGTGNAAKFYYPTGIALDGAGNIYVTDTYNQRIRKITQQGVVTTIAGSGPTGPGNGAYADGALLSALFNLPSGITLDAAGNIFVADYGNSLIRKINATAVSTIAGGTQGEKDSTGILAEFAGPTGIAVDAADNLFVTDLVGTIRKITSAGVVTTIAGANMSATSGAFARPAGIAIDASGNLFVADYTNNVIDKITFK